MSHMVIGIRLFGSQLVMLFGETWLEEVFHGRWGLRFKNVSHFPVCYFCFVLAVQDIMSWFPVSAAVPPLCCHGLFSL